MLPTKYSLIGAVLIALGMLLVGVAFNSGPGQIALAGNGGCTIGGTTNTPTFTPTPDPAALTALQQLPTCTPTEDEPNRTHTPTPSGTGEATQSPPAQNTPVPNTPGPAPTNTPSGGSGAGVSGPDTGFGDGTIGSDGGASTWLMALGAALAIIGAGAITAGRRKNR